MKNELQSYHCKVISKGSLLAISQNCVYPKLVVIVLGLCLCSGCLCSCGGIVKKPPFILSEPECVLASGTESFQIAGVKFSVWNLRQTEIKSLSVVFSVYDDENGVNPFVGGNVVSATLECSIMPGECEEFEAGLDSYIYRMPEKPYFIDFFYLKSVGYENGQMWRDPAGVFFVRGKNEK